MPSQTRSVTRRADLAALALGFKAETVLGMQLALRHRTARLAGVLALLVIALVRHADGSPARWAHVLVLVAGTIAVAAASRLFAPGPALAAARRSAALCWIAPCGRLAGVLLVVLAAVLVAAAVFYGGNPGEGFTALAASLGFAAAAAAVTAGLTPLVGASGAAALGFVPVWFGGLPPRAVAVTLGAWPPLARPILVLWNVLPLPWRALDLLEHRLWTSGAVLIVWLVLGLAVAAWSVADAPAGGGG